MSLQPPPTVLTTIPSTCPATCDLYCDVYLAHAHGYYAQQIEVGGSRHLTRESYNMRDALRAIRAVAGPKPPESIRAEDLYAAQQWMLQQRTRHGDRWTRKFINACINRIRRAWKWGTKPPRRWFPIEVLMDLKLVDPLQRDRSEAREEPDVPPVSEHHFKQTLEALAQLAIDRPSKARWASTLITMLELQWHSGMRPGELVRIRSDELTVERIKFSLFEEEREIMVYRPFRHKSRHHGLDRNIFLCPEARRLVEDQITRTKDTGPQLWSYTVSGFGHALSRVQRRLNVPEFFSNQVRHAYATRMREKSGIDVVQVLLGHRHRSTTEIYGKPDALAALRAIHDHG